MLKKIKAAADYIKENISGFVPEIGMVLGSGLGVIGDLIEDPVYAGYADIPHFPVSTVKGHKGRFVFGKYCGKKVIAMQGRFHYYEGYTMDEVTFPIRVMKLLGVEKLIITNAAGGINTDFTGGTLMLITDHINIMANPLIGRNIDQMGPRFPDASNIYCAKTNAAVIEAAKAEGIDLREGVYFYFTGPSYETPAEIRLAKILGADAAGMSTAPEAVVAAHMGIPVTGISCISNMAAGISKEALDHKDVLSVTERVQKSFIELVGIVLGVM